MQVLLENLNSCPPDLLERINSLLEERPSLNIYERGDEGELVVHPDFRVLCTADVSRPFTHRHVSCGIVL